MKDNGRITSLMERAMNSLQIRAVIKDISRRESSMEKECLSGLMEECTRVSGKTAR